MSSTSSHPESAFGTDPFLERGDDGRVLRRQLLGGSFRFESASARLLDLVDAAYAGLPQHKLPIIAPEFHVELRLVPPRRKPVSGEPPAVQMQSGADLLCGMMDASNYVVMSPAQGKALVVASEDMLDHPYHVRYELIEFAVFTLATRGLGLVPLHGACVGRNGRGLLLLGASGSGKSTLALHSLLCGLDFLAEDAVFVEPGSMLATGIANFLHVQAEALRFVDDAEARYWIGEAPVIRRRSGVEKHEADLRRGQGSIATAPLELAGAVFVSSEWGDDPEVLLERLPEADAVARLTLDQPYASGQPGWQAFQQRLATLGMYELRRGAHPRNSVDALLTLLR
ncbi:serine kinase [Dyella koreensis]|uniref:Serine kinase n=1 Tax=Dyella koreensis TaxID=311235 RepID=A0ABW8K839_9GAMM